jgi:hypothetical protein
MNKAFMEYVYKRCEAACTENVEYTELQSQISDVSKDRNSELYEELDCQIGAKAEELCYIQGFNDAMQLVINSK